MGAIKEWEEGWILSRRPAFLLNIAQAYRELGEARTALRYYRLYVEKAPEARDAAEVNDIIRELELELGEEPRGRDDDDDDRPPRRDDDDDDDRRPTRADDDDDDPRRHMSPEERRAYTELGPGAFESWRTSGLTLEGFKRVRVGTGMLIGGVVAAGAGVVAIVAMTIVARSDDGMGNPVLPTAITTPILITGIVAAIAGVYLIYYGSAVRRKGFAMKRPGGVGIDRIALAPMVLPDGGGLSLTLSF